MEDKYPQLMEEYQEKENETSMSQRVGYPVENAERDSTTVTRAALRENVTGTKVRHQSKMLSLLNTYNRDELTHFIDKVQQAVRSKNVSFTMEKKFDGMALSLLFDQNGFLMRAVTRGDGVEGEDITNPIVHHVFNGKRHDLIDNVLGTTIEVRGEVLMNKKAFQELNEQRERDGKETFRNPRNLVAGVCRQKHIDERFACEFMAYSLLVHSPENLDEPIPDSHYKLLMLLRKMGLQTDPSPKLSSSVTEIFSTISELESKRDELLYEIDGVVVKVDNTQLQKKLGEISRAPRWAISYKFEARKAITTLNDITYQVGRTGKIIPVALLEPIELGGVQISRATLHNFQYIHQHQLNIGDRVQVERAADVIPKVTSIQETPKENYVFHLPKTCPCELGSRLVVKGADLCCIHPQCPQQLHKTVKHFVSKTAFNIKGLAGSIIQDLLDKEMISSISDIFRLHEKQHELLKLRGWKAKKLDNVLTEIEKAREGATLERLLNALGICGKEQASLLTDRYKNIDSLRSASAAQLMKLEGIGELTARDIVSKVEKCHDIIEELKSLGIRFDKVESSRDTKSSVSSGAALAFAAPKPQVLQGKGVAVSGTFHLFNHRDDLKAEIEAHGGSVKASLSKKVDYFVAGEKCGPKKIEQARALNVRVIDESTFCANFLPGWRTESSEPEEQV